MRYYNNYIDSIKIINIKLLFFIVMIVYMKNTIQYITFVFHFILTFGIYVTTLVSNNIDILTLLLMTTIMIKIMYYIYGRCILTVIEENDEFPNMESMFMNLLSPHNTITSEQGEAIIINMGLINLLVKILFLRAYSSIV